MNPKFVLFESGLFMNAREKNTVSKMISLYCRSRHGSQGTVCPGCRDLENYAHARLERCLFGESKPACKKCTVHCYKSDYRLKMQEVMRFSGPRMLFYHPVDTVRHFWKTL